MAASLLFLVSPLLAGTYTVSSTGNSGANTLRKAIQDANLNPGPDEIVFRIGSGPQTITLLYELDAITEQVTINGATQPGFVDAPLIALDGGGTLLGGLHILAPDCLVRGLVISNFNGDAVWLVGKGGTVLEGNLILHNAGAGVHVQDCPRNTIGGTGAGQGNVISANRVGVLIEGSGASDNRVQGNLIGSDGVGTGNKA